MTVSEQARSISPLQAAQERRARTIGVLFALIVVILFSAFNIVSRLGSDSGLALWDIAALRFAIGGLILLPFFLRRREPGLSGTQAISIAFLGGLGFALFAYAGFYLAPASHGAVLLHGTLPLFTFLIMLAFGDAVRRGAIPGVALIAIGIGIMAFDTMRGATATQLTGDGFLLLASLCWSTYGVMIRRKGISSTQAAATVVVFSACAYLPVYLTVFGIDGLLAAEPSDALLQAVFQGVLVGALSIFVYTHSVACLGPTGTALFTAAIPCVTSLAAIPILDEHPGLVAWTGVAVVTVGMVTAFAERLVRR